MAPSPALATGKARWLTWRGYTAQGLENQQECRKKKGLTIYIMTI